jgi:hypothetical protein
MGVFCVDDEEDNDDVGAPPKPNKGTTKRIKKSEFRSLFFI